MQSLLIPTKIIKSKRKSISLIIDNNGDFIVRSPILATQKQINKFINEKQNWIIQKRQAQILNQINPIKVENQEKLNILEKTYSIFITNSGRVKLDDDKIIIPNVNSKEKLISYIKKIAKTTIGTYVNKYCNSYGFSYNGITINSAKTRWGSCSGNNKLNFTYKLMFCPYEVVEYIVIHELCHTKIKNHDKNFWSLVKSYCPNYKACERWLKNNRSIVNYL